jgi:hypothetical protein
MAIAYSTTSPYYNTPTQGFYLDVWNGITIAPDITDALYQIDSPYNLRPDLLAYDMYKDTGLWWVFAIRNPDVLLDPLLNFVTGTVIYVPTRTTVQHALGI